MKILRKVFGYNETPYQKSVFSPPSSKSLGLPTGSPVRDINYKLSKEYREDMINSIMLEIDSRPIDKTLYSPIRIDDIICEAQFIINDMYGSMPLGTHIEIVSPAWDSFGETDDKIPSNVLGWLHLDLRRILSYTNAKTTPIDIIIREKFYLWDNGVFTIKIVVDDTNYTSQVLLTIYAGNIEYLNSNDVDIDVLPTIVTKHMCVLCNEKVPTVLNPCTCSRCGAIYHIECAMHVERCAILGCDNTLT